MVSGWRGSAKAVAHWGLDFGAENNVSSLPRSAAAAPPVETSDRRAPSVITRPEGRHEATRSPASGSMAEGPANSDESEGSRPNAAQLSLAVTCRILGAITTLKFPAFPSSLYEKFE